MTRKSPKNPERTLICVVPFCDQVHVRGQGANHMTRNGVEWICVPHLAQVPLITRRVFARCKKRRDVLGGGVDRKYSIRLDRAWARCKRQALEGAVGI